MKPGYAVVVVGVVGAAVVGVVVAALIILVRGPGDPATGDPNAETIAAIVTAAITALSSLAAAYFGIRVASEAANQANATAQQAMVLSDRVVNSTLNGNPEEKDF